MQRLVEPPSYDISVYAQGYTERILVDRLLYIASRSPVEDSITRDAYREATQSIKANTLDTDLYKRTIEQWRTARPQDESLSVLDQVWIDETIRKAKDQEQKLQQELKSYRNNLIKESIRMGQTDLANYYYSIGDLPAASANYAKTREFCTLLEQTFSMNFNIIKMSLLMQQFGSIAPLIKKIKAPRAKGAKQNSSTGHLTERQNSQLHIMGGVASFCLGDYKAAADDLFQASKLDCLNDIVTAHDISVLAGLAALASYTRKEMLALLDKASAKLVLDNEPQLRTAIKYFCASSFAQCFGILNRLRNDFEYDIYIGETAESIYKDIRRRALVQTLTPYNQISLCDVQKRLSFDLNLIQNDAIELIKLGKIPFRLDRRQQILHTSNDLTADQNYVQANRTISEYKQGAELALFHMRIVSAGLEVKTDKTQA